MSVIGGCPFFASLARLMEEVDSPGHVGWDKALCRTSFESFCDAPLEIALRCGGILKESKVLSRLFCYFLMVFDGFSRSLEVLELRMYRRAVDLQLLPAVGQARLSEALKLRCLLYFMSFHVIGLFGKRNSYS